MRKQRSRHPLRWIISFIAVSLGALATALVPAMSQADSPIPPPYNGSDTPVVLIVLDELPSANLMTADGNGIHAGRYPNIAKFAKQSTWYKDNIAAGDFTAWAVPPILTGNLANERILPTTAAQPNNIFTLLGPGRRMHVMEKVTELCPKSLCPNGNQGGAPNETLAHEFIKAKFKSFDPKSTRSWIKGLPKGKGTLSVAHVESPHLPLRFTPEGKIYPGGNLWMPTNLKLNGWTVNEPAVSFVQQRHLLQTGFTDKIVGEILKKIRKNGDFDKAMIVLTADHGNSFDPKDLRRDLTRTNAGATVNPPLFIKYPKQKQRAISGASTQSIDILPTIAAELGASIPATDGMKISEIPAGRLMTVRKDELKELKLTTAEMKRDRVGVLADQYRRLGGGGLWKMGPRSDLIGKRPGRRVVRGAAKVNFNQPAKLERADASDRVVPAMVSGRLNGVSEGQILALSWNGRIVATTRAFKYLNEMHFGAMVPPKVMKRGQNRVSLYLLGQNGLRKVAPY